MTTATPDAIDNMIEEYLVRAQAIKTAKRFQDDIKRVLQANMIRREIEEITSYKGTVKRITVAKTVAFRGPDVYDLAGVWHVSKDPIFAQCGSLLMNLANFKPERQYLRISAPK